ncbi:ACT domain-containing protein [Vitiosangium sp. GDMCC 1.1324]|uniref:ACT domain-containing protein n=1 Tax=Vitiosangium sp. (strain GDMCC 1.1324) TaxID=2138576 RepID=UPI000D35410D|nr:ACT domain-containing protein [Vitiosangium sp. GDMCC 1.1324]PTL77165.1 transporter [Vitiosangium sp. GDMCC 1.1324]
MSGETNLDALLKSMRPVLRDGEFVFCTTPEPPPDLGALEPVGFFREDEGLTLILRRERAEAAGFQCSAAFRMVTLSVHSSLEAVGFLAAITSWLATHGISVNPVSGYYHDHLFVLADRVEECLSLLTELSLQG